MKVIGILSQKGGVGKTTLAMNLAVAAAYGGEPSIVFDMDPQQSATVFHRLRVNNGHDDQPMVKASSYQTLVEGLRAAAADGYKVAIIDTPPNAVSKDVEVAAGAEVVLVPVTPSFFDIAAIEATIAIASKHTSGNGFAVLNMAKHYGDHVEVAKEAITSNFDFPVAPMTIGDRMAFKNAARNGQGVLESEPSSKAAEEILALWSFVNKAIATKRKADTANRKEAVNG
ncbi:MAG: ParA family protein [Pseudomonadota bacterium]